MAILNGNVPRFTDGSPHPDHLAAGGHGELIIGGATAAFASGSNPNAEVIDGTGTEAGNATSNATVTASAGSVSPHDEGEYLVTLNLQDFSCAAASGNVQFDVQYAPDGSTFAAFGLTDATGNGGRMQAIRAAATGKAGLTLERVQKLNARSAVRAIVTSAAGGVITVTEGSLRIRKVADANPPTK